MTIAEPAGAGTAEEIADALVKHMRICSTETCAARIIAKAIRRERTAAESRAMERCLSIIDAEIVRQDAIAPLGENEWTNGACVALQNVESRIRSSISPQGTEE